MKAYGELPENAKINETETFGEEEGECTFEFGDEEEVDIDEILLYTLAHICISILASVRFSHL